MREKQLLQRNNNSCQVTGKEIAGDMREKQLLQRNNNSSQVTGKEIAGGHERETVAPEK